MKILEINSVCGSGSTGRIACDIKSVLENQNESCKIAYGRGFFGENGCIKLENKFEFLSHTLISRISDRQGFYSLHATKRLIDLINEYEPDIIHLHNIHGYYVNIGTLFEYLKEYDKPVVWTLHDCWAFTGHCAYFDYVGCDKWRTGCNKCPQKKNYPASLLIDNSEKNYYDKKRLFSSIQNLNIVTPSKWLADLVGQSFLKNCNISVIYNGIDLEKFHRVESNFKNKYNIGNKKMILGVANVWEKRKGIDDFIKLSEMIDDKCQIVLVGVSEKMKKDMPKNIICISRTGSIEELAQIYSAADVFVNPTYEDNFPTTNLEALACGTPVITYKTGGSPEAVDENCGIVIEKGDINKLADAIKNINLSAEQCVKRAKSFDKSINYLQYVELYKSLLN